MQPVKLVDKLKKSKRYLQELFISHDNSPAKLKITDLTFFVRFMKPVLNLYIVCLGLTIVITILGTVLPLAGKFFIDFVVMKNSASDAGKILGPLYPGIVTPEMLSHLGSVKFLVLSMFVLGMIVSILGMIKSYLSRKFEQELTFNIQTALFNRVLRFPLSYLKNRQTGYLMSRISGDIGAVTGLINQVVSQAFSSVFTALFSFSIIFALNRKLALILLFVIPVTMTVNHFFSRRYRSISRKERESDAKVSQDMQEILSGLEVVKLYNAEEKEARKVSDRLRTLNALRLKSLLTASFAQFFSSGAQSALTMLIMWVGAMEIAGGAMTIGDYLAFTTYSVTIAASINSILYLQLSLQPLLASIERLREMFRVTPESEAVDERKMTMLPGGCKGDVEFRDVGFTYEGKKPVLNSISFRATRGDVVALVGPSGAGKTTIINLLLKFYQPTSGAVFLDRHDLAELKAGDLRNQISVVSQDIFLFNETIEHNIRYGRTDATHDDVVAAAALAHLDMDIREMPDGFNTVVGERGNKLSVGQRQRISLARAFLKNAPVLVLDEPTSSLDTLTEALLRDSLAKQAKDRTTIIISHRLFVSDLATQILVIGDGRVIETGTHEELMKKDALYTAMYNADRMKMTTPLARNAG
jgi:ABC-type multidrug transport system fused ATPase/permease subunit